MNTIPFPGSGNATVPGTASLPPQKFVDRAMNMFNYNPDGGSMLVLDTGTGGTFTNCELAIGFSTTLSGTVTATDTIQTILCPDVTSVTGTFIFAGNLSLSAVDFSKLTTLSGSLYLGGSSSLTSVSSLAALTTIGGILSFAGASSLSDTLDLSGLTTAAGTLDVSGTMLSNVPLSSLTSCGTLNFSGCSSLGSFAAPLLASCGTLDLSNSSISSANLDSLASVSTLLSFAGCSSISAINLPLTSLAGSLSFASTAMSVTLSNLVTYAGAIDITNANIGTLEFQNLTSFTSGNIDFSPAVSIGVLNLNALNTAVGLPPLNGGEIHLNALTSLDADITINLGMTSTLTFAAMTSIPLGKTLNVDGSGLTTLGGLSALTSVAGTLSVQAMSSLTDASLNITSVASTGGIIIASPTSLTTANFASLVTLSGALNLSGNTNMTSANFAALVTLDGGLDLSAMPSLGGVPTFSAFTTIGSSASLNFNNSGIGTLSLPVTSMNGLISLQNGSATELTFPNCIALNGTIDITGSNVGILRFPALTGIGTTPPFLITDGGSILTELHMPALTSLLNFPTINDDLSITTLDLSGLATMDVDLDLTQHLALSTLDLSHLGTIMTGITLTLSTPNGSLGTLSLSSLTTLQGTINANGNALSAVDLSNLSSFPSGAFMDFRGTSLASFTLPSALTTLSGIIYLSGLSGSLTTVTVNATTIDATGQLNMNSSAGLTDVELNSLVTLAGSVDLGSCSFLTGLSLPVLATLSGSLDISGTGFSAESLATGDLVTFSGTIYTGSINLSFSLPACTTFSGQISRSGGTLDFSLPSLAVFSSGASFGVSGDLGALTLDALTSLADFPARPGVGPTSLSLNGLTTLDVAVFDLSSSSALATFSASSLNHIPVSTALNLSNSSLSALTMDALGMLDGVLVIHGAASMSTASFASLTSVGGSLDLSSNASLTTINLSALTTIGTGATVDLSGIAGSDSFTLPLTSHEGTLNISNQSGVTGPDGLDNFFNQLVNTLTAAGSGTIIVDHTNITAASQTARDALTALGYTIGIL